MDAASTPRRCRIDELDESTRLLHDEEHGNSSTQPQAKDPTPLPKAQLGALITARIVQPIAYMQIFPYINQFLADLHIAAPEQVGFYSGFVESVYSLAEMLSVYQWGGLSDAIGRRPVAMMTLIGIAVTTIVFGCSTSLVTLLASRFFCGLVGTNIAVLHSILVEITDDTNEHITVPLYSLAWSAGSVLGSLIGGTFANAATRYPNYFAWPMFLEHPYLPPCVISAGCALLGTWLTYLFIKETLPCRGTYDTNDVPDNTLSSTSNTETLEETEYTSMKALVAIPGLRALMLSGLAISFLTSAFDVIFSLFCYAPVHAGGLGFQPSTIGNFLAFADMFSVLFRLVAMPYILRRFDSAATYNMCTWLWPFTFSFMPLLNAFSRARLPAGAEVGIWIGLGLIQILAKVAEIPFTITMLLVKRHTPTSTLPATSTSGPTPATQKPGTGSALGRSNGLVQFSMSLGRVIGPVVVSTLFTALNGSTWARQWGVEWTWAAVMVCFAFAGARIARDVR